MSRFLVVPVLAALLAADAQVRCPVDGTRFTPPPRDPPARTHRLDLNPVGARPRLLAHCPVCHAVFDHLPDEEELAQMRRAMTSGFFEQSRSTGSDPLLHFALRAADLTGGARTRLMLEAAWSVENDPPRWRALVEDVLAELAQVERGSPVTTEEWRTAQTLRVELLRRAGRLEEARAALRALQAQADFRRGIHARVLAREQDLVDTRDTGPHDVPALDGIDARLEEPAWRAALALFDGKLPADLVEARLEGDQLLLSARRGNLTVTSTARSTRDVVTGWDRLVQRVRGIAWLDEESGRTIAVEPVMTLRPVERFACEGRLQPAWRMVLRDRAGRATELLFAPDFRKAIIVASPEAFILVDEKGTQKRVELDAVKTPFARPRVQGRGQSLWNLVARSSDVVVARVDGPAEMRAPHTFVELLVPRPGHLRLTTIERLKGQAPAEPVVTATDIAPGSTVIAFLSPELPGTWRLRGWLPVDEDALPIFRARISEAASLTALDVDWLVRVASRRVTRAYAVEDLPLNLPPAQREALVKGFLDEPSSGPWLPRFVDVVGRHPSNAFDATLASIVEAEVRGSARWMPGLVGALAIRMGLLDALKPFPQLDATTAPRAWERMKAMRRDLRVKPMFLDPDPDDGRH